MIFEVITITGQQHVIKASNFTERISKTSNQAWYVFKDEEGKDVILIDIDSVESIEYIR